MPRHIQVKATKPRIQYVSDGSRREFVYPFAVFTEASLEVYLDTTKQAAGFVVNGIGQTNGGSVVFSNPPAAGVVVTLRRQLVVERTSDFQESGQFRAKIINDELDYLTAAIQQVEVETERSVRLEPADREAQLTLPSASARAGKALVFDNEGNVTAKSLDWFAGQSATLNLDTIKEGSSNKHFTLIDKAKLSGIEEQARANPRPVTPDEKSAGAETGARTFSPQDVKDMVALHAAGTSPVQSVHGRIGKVTAQAGDYNAALIADSSDKVIMTAAERAKLAGVEAGAQANVVASVHGRTGDVTAQPGDYSAAQIADSADKVIMTAAEREKLARLADAGESATYGSDEISNQSSVEGVNVSDAIEAAAAIGVAGDAFASSHATVGSAHGSDDILNESAIEGLTVSAALEALHNQLARDASSWQPPVLDILDTPPSSPESGARYLVGASPVGAWAGHANDIATWTGNSWSFVTPAPGWTVIVLDALVEYTFDFAEWSATGGSISADRITGALAYEKIGEIDSGSLLGRAASGQGSAQQVAVSHGLELTPDGNLRLSGVTTGSTVRGFYGRDTTGAYGFNEILAKDIKGIGAARLLGNATTVTGAAAGEIALGYGLAITATPAPAIRLSGVTGAPTQRQFYRTTSTGGFGFDDIIASDVKNVGPGRLLGNATATAGAAAEIPIGTGSAASIPTLGDADRRYLRTSFADSAATVASVAADDVIALNDTSAAGAIVRAPVSALPFVQVGQRGSANGVGSLDGDGRQPITEAADGAAEERAFVVTTASYTVARRVLIARDGCNEIALTAAAGAYKNIYISNEKISGSLNIRAVAGETINGAATLTLGSGQSAGLVVVDGSPPTSWRAEISAAASPPQFPLTIVSNRGHVSNASTPSSGANREVLFRLAYWTTKRSAVSGLRLVYANIGMLATGETDGLATMYPRASIEYDGVARRVYFNGRREGVVEPGGILISDPVGIRIPPNTQFWIKSLARTANAGEQYYPGYPTKTSLGEGFVTSAAAVDTPGALVSALSGSMWPVAAVLGITEESDPPSCVIIGSSSAFGQGEISDPPVPADRGYLARFVSTNFGYSVLAAGSQSAAQWVADPSRRLAFLAAVRPSIVIAELGANDIANGNSFNTVRDNLLAVWRTIADLGIKVYPTTFTPRTTSTDAWTTTTNQTVGANEAVRVQANDFIRGNPAPCSGFLEVADIAETARNSGKWKVYGGAWTNDGVHTTRHADIAAGLSLSALGVN